MLILTTTNGKKIQLDEDHIRSFELQLGNNRIYKNSLDNNYYMISVEVLKEEGKAGCKGTSTKLTNH